LTSGLPVLDFVLSWAGRRRMIMARDIQRSLGALLVIFIVIAYVMNFVFVPTRKLICNGRPCGPFPPFRIQPPIITFIQSLPLLSVALLAASLFACGIGNLLLVRNRASVAGVILAYTPFITLVVVGFLAIIYFPAPPIHFA
jgi:hypothetical protein